MNIKSLLTIIVIALFISLSSATTLSAQNSKKRAKIETSDLRIGVKLNGLLAIGVINPAVEFKVFKNGTVQLEAMGVFQPKGFLGSDKPLTLGTAFGEFRYYIKSAFDGFYVGGHAGWGVYRLSKGLAPGYGGAYPNSYQVGSNMMFGATIGYQLNLTKHWALELSWGAGWQESVYEGYKADGTQYVALNRSGEWLPAYKGGLFVAYRF